MEVHSNTVNYSFIGKRLWNILRIAFFMVRKGFLSKRKLVMDMNLMMKRGKLLRKTLINLIFHHHHHSHSHSQDYEFSCSNSPNPVIFHVAKRKHHYLNFPCINPPPRVEEEESDMDMEMDMAVLVLSSNNNNNNLNKTKQQFPADPYSYSFRYDADTPEEALSPLLSPFSIRITNNSEEEEEEDDDEGDGGDANSRRVDDDAEEFIRRFYEQLRVQSRSTQLLQYEEEMQYQEMLARGTR
ncbi:hypothetical protein NE237_020911 [Protea cynaroides]|uniref:Uncharacterized protein n=1 Tax=Protea cynaroides TaxID=273540 RepID=A0A9Q0H9D2_9MAGN|nr:hypothetical protein NE237_020911 [Protea cynaroides]